MLSNNVITRKYKMMQVKNLLLLIVLACSNASAQEAADTTALMKEFGKVMSFTTQPFLYYTTTTKMTAEPVIEAMDTLRVEGVFYKHDTEIYSNNSREELYLQDSLMIEVNNDRKQIWIRKVDVATKANLNLLPLNTKEVLDNFTKTYIIKKEKKSDDVSVLYFEGRKPDHNTSATTTFISVEYSEKTYLPKLIEITIELKQPVDEETIAAIKAEGLDESKLVRTTDGVKQLFRKQMVSINFTTIDSKEGQAAKIPSYKDRVEFDVNSMQFSGKGQYSDYEIVKTF